MEKVGSRLWGGGFEDLGINFGYLLELSNLIKFFFYERKKSRKRLD